MTLVEQLFEALGQVGVDEFQTQETQFDEDSRLGRELLYLSANDQWLRASREIVALQAADSLDTRLNIHVDLAQITHEAFRNRVERLWLPLALLPPPIEQPAGTRRARRRPGPRRLVPTPTVRDANGTVLPSLPQSEARRWVAAALAEIVLTMAPPALPGARSGRYLAREQRLLLSAALLRVLRDGETPRPELALAGAFVPAPSEDDEDSHRRSRMHQARRDLLDLVGEIRSLTAGSDPAAERSRLLIERAFGLVNALRSPASLVVLGVEPSTRAGVFSVEIVGRPLIRSRSWTWYGPRARIDLDVLLPATAADHAVIVSLPEGLSFGAPGGGAPSPVQAVDVVERPPALAQLLELSRQLTPAGTPLDDATARCLVDLTLARLDAVRDTFRHYRAVSVDRRGAAAQPLGPGGVPQIVGDYWAALAAIGERDVAARAAAAAHGYLEARGRQGEFEYRRVLSSGVVSPNRAHVRIPPVENRTVRATPLRASVRLYLRADSSALNPARASAFLSLLLLAALWLFELVASKQPDQQVVASVLTLFAAIQAGRIQGADWLSLRGLVVSSFSAFMIMASVLPPVLLGLTFAFTQATWASGFALVAQLVVYALMLGARSTDRWWRRSLVRTEPLLRLTTGQPLDYARTDVLHESWWRSTTAGALLLGTAAHAYVIPQDGLGIPELLDPVPQLGPAPVVARVDNRIVRRVARFAARAGEQIGVARPQANILAMLRAGNPGSSLTFAVFREEPEPAWMQNTRASVYLDVDRLNVSEVPIGNLDVYLGFPATSFAGLADHPLRRLLDLAGRRSLLLVDVQFPAPPPRGGEPARLWARTRLGLRADEIEHVTGLLAEIRQLAPGGRADPLDLLIDLSGDTPPRRFSGVPGADPDTPVRPRDLDVLRTLPTSPPAGPPGPAGMAEASWLSIAAYDYVRPGVESDLLDRIDARHPGLELAGLTTARLHGVSLVFLLGRRTRGIDLTALTTLPATAGPGPDERFVLERPLSTAALGRFPADGVLLRVYARYSDRARLFADLLEELARGFGEIAGRPYVARDLHLAYLHTEVADGRNAVARYMVVLAGADPVDFGRAELDRVERGARRVLTRAHAEAVVGDIGSLPAAKALVSIQLLTTPEPAATGSSQLVGVDLDADGGRPARAAHPGGG